MDSFFIERHFAKIGARAKVSDHSTGRRRQTGVSIDIGFDKAGEFFDIALNEENVEQLAVIDTKPQQRHLLLLVQNENDKHKFLCGHDERHWFVAAVPEREAASSVATAMEGLKPREVRILQDRLKVKPRNRNRRRNEAFVRQGEWFFVPQPNETRVNQKFILRNEPLRRGGGKPHFVEELVREGGETVYVCHRHPNGLTQQEYEKLISQKPALRNLNWILQRRNPQVLVRGKVRHADHKTILLPYWHRVLMNTETESVAMRHVAFID